MMAGLSFVLLGIIVLAVDGSGLFLDKARFTQGLEQGALALVAENNTYRKNKSHDDVLRQNVDNSLFSSQKLSVQQKERNLELLRDIARHYYYPSSYGRQENIEDNYKFECRKLADQSISCQVAGNFNRPSWLYMTSDSSTPQLSFAKKINISSDTLYAQKSWYQEYSYPPKKDDKEILLDVMFVLDLSFSMRLGLPSDRRPKIDILIDNINKIAKKVFDDHPSNRVGFVGYSYAVRTSNSAKTCVLPYVLSKEIMDYEYFWHYFNISEEDMKRYHSDYNYKHKYTWTDYNDKQEFAFLLPHLPDIPETLKMIDRFSGDTNPNWFRHINKTQKSTSCLSNTITTDLWFSKNESGRFFSRIRDLRRIPFAFLEAPSGTLSSAGLIVASNLILKSTGFQYSQADTVNAIRRKVLIIVSDGVDEDTIAPTGGVHPTVTKQLIEQGLCDRIRTLVDSQQNPLVAPSIIGFIALGYEGNNEKEWRECTKNYYVAHTDTSLFNSLSAIIGTKVDSPPTINTKIEEVGHSLQGVPQGWR